jgi:hypothetical protein
MKAVSGVQVTDNKDFNNQGLVFQFSHWPKPWISGAQGCCSILAAYYIIEELTALHFANLKETVPDGTSIYATDGTYTVIHEINKILGSSKLVQIYPSLNRYFANAEEAIFHEDTSKGGKFLIELSDLKVTSLDLMTHFISLNSYKMEIYDPTYHQGPILTERNIDGFLIILETLFLRNVQSISKVWKLVQVGEKKKSKRTGAKRIKTKNYMLK